MSDVLKIIEIDSNTAATPKNLPKPVFYILCITGYYFISVFYIYKFFFLYYLHP